MTIGACHPELRYRRKLRRTSNQNARRFWYSLLHQNAAAALSVSISPEGSAVFWIKCFRPTPAPRSQKIPKMKILGVGGLENYLCIIQISAIGPCCRSDRGGYGGSIRKGSRHKCRNCIEAVTKRREMYKIMHIEAETKPRK